MEFLRTDDRTKLHIHCHSQMQGGENKRSQQGQIATLGRIAELSKK